MCRTFPPFRLQPPVAVPGIGLVSPRSLPRSLPAASLTRDKSVTWASPYLGGWPRQPAESSSSSYGSAVHLQLLSTSSHEDAVTFSYNVQTQLGKDLHLADSTHLQTHNGWPFGPKSIVFSKIEHSGTRFPDDPSFLTTEKAVIDFRGS